MRIGALWLLAAVLACRSTVNLPAPEVNPRLVTTAGGTWVTARNIPFALKAPFVEIGLLDKSGGSVIDWFQSEGVKIMDLHTLMFKTPQMIEACGRVRLTDGVREIILPQALCFHTLAFTANQSAHTMSVVDTVNNETFGPKDSMPLSATAAPISLAYNVAYPPARVLYALDKASGNMQCFDASNFLPLDLDSETPLVQNTLVLQKPSPAEGTYTAFDQALTQTITNIEESFITHVTAGIDSGTNPTPGGLSWLTPDWWGVPMLRDVDDDLEISSPGAPDGITRATLCVGDPPVCEVPDGNFYPLSIKIVALATEVPGYVVHDREPWGGIYAFVSGVGYKEYEYSDRKVLVAVLDLNPFLYCDPAAHPRDPDFCEGLDRYNCGMAGNYCNDRWWRFQQNYEGHANYKTLEAGIDNPTVLGDTKHAMDFAADSGSPSLGPTLYVLGKDNIGQDKAYVFHYHYDQGNFDWEAALDANQDPLTIATGTSPTGVKVQTVTILGEDFSLAYITNAGDDTVTVVNTATNEEILDSPISENLCYDPENGNHPVAFGTRSTGDYGYAANAASGAVSVIDLAQSDCYFPEGSNGAIELGSSSEPLDIVVQPVPDPSQIFGQMVGMMVFSASADYTVPEDKEEMLGDWKAIHQLVLTPASPTAIKAALNAFLNKTDQKVKKDKLKSHIKQTAKLYRAAYLHDHPGN